MKKILVTGGAGYIGSHTCVELLETGYEIVVLDNLSNSSMISLNRVREITGKTVDFIRGDIRDGSLLDSLFSENHFDAVIHFAGLKAVGESVEKPLEYYENNVVGTINLIRSMQKAGIKNLVFSSSATVYGTPEVLPISETAPRSATNPYGQTKLMVEHILEDLCCSDLDWKVACLRYFNPVGAHESGLIGEDPNGIPNNLMPYISQVAVGIRERLSVFGGDYPTVDGTGVRDYIHVVDLAKGHLAALDYLFSLDKGKFSPINLGTGKGVSVLEMVQAFGKVNGCKVPYHITNRRAGDVAECYADASLAFEKLHWRAELGIEQMCADAWKFQNKNPNGYKK